jgi:dihydrolipoamide dehydrogenase
MIKKILIVFVLVSVFLIARYFNLQEYLSFESLKNNKELLFSYYNENQLQFVLVYLGIYILSTAVSFPGAAILTLAGGAIFGLWLGLGLVSFASTIGATLSFLGSRYLFRDFFEKKFKSQLDSINQGISKDGAFYLFTLRMIPIFPFFLINLVMGLTKISVIQFFFVSQVGMLLGTFVFVNAGTELAKINSIKEIASPQILLAFSLLGIVPLIAKFIINFIQAKKIYSRFKKPKKFDFNLIVIGAGAGGLVTSYIASAVKAKVALIEKHKMGGDCLNYGCVPSKAIIASSKKVHLRNKFLDYGLSKVQIEFNFKDIMKRVTEVIQKIEPNDSVDRYSKLGVDCFTGDAKLLSPFEVSLNGKILTAKNIVIASGAEPLVPKIKGLDETKFYTSETLWNLEKLPEELLILGGGPIGSEIAQAFARLGSKVTILEMADRILSKEDKEVSESIKHIFEKEGIRVLTKHKLIRFEKNIGVCEFEGKEIRIPFTELFLALGRKARVKDFGLEEIGIELNQNGTIKVDEYMRTNFPNIFACGDVAGPYQFTHVAAYQAWFAAVNSLFGIFKKFKVDYRVIPRTTFTDPEVASVGLNEMEANEKHIDYEISQYEISELDRAIADGEAKGFIKVLTKKKSDEILGVTIVSNNAGEILAEYVLAMKYKLGLNKILGTIHSYPTMSEANKYVAGSWKKAHKPEKVLQYLEKFHTWRRS